ncbi:MAG: gas vesicle protein GvpJ [Sideroxyarcus sp.]|nr:gas vesicle protein GvpJ [Sideroxyarcus sp.]
MGLSEEKSSSLCELLDRVLNTGVVAMGEVVISVAGVDLIYLNLQLLLTSVETALVQSKLLQEGA